MTGASVAHLKMQHWQKAIGRIMSEKKQCIEEEQTWQRKQQAIITNQSQV